MKCPSCARDLPTDAQFCLHCGTKIVDKELPTSTADTPVDLASASPPSSVALEEGTSAQSDEEQVVSYDAPTIPVTDYPPNNQSTHTLANVPITPATSSSSQPFINDASTITNTSTSTVQLPTQPNWAQQLLIRIFQPGLGSNPWLGVVLGGIIPVLLSIIIFALFHTFLVTWLQSLVSNDLAKAFSESKADVANSTVAQFFHVQALQNTMRDTLQLFLSAQGIGQHSSLVSNASGLSSTTASEMTTDTMSLSGLLFIPALFLILGGYISASTDFSNRPLSSIWRGAAIALPYTFLLYLLSTQVNGNIPFPFTSSSNTNASSTLSIDIPSLLFFGLLWGVLFGLLGASLKLAQGRWRYMLHSYLLNNPRPQLAAIVTGGLAATTLGLALSLLTFYCLLAFTAFSIPFLTNHLCSSTDWYDLVLFGLAQGPVHAVLLFGLSIGAPVTIMNQATNIFSNTADGSSAPSALETSSCFYTNQPHATVSLLGGDIHLQPWAWLLVLIPIICLFLGGRISVAASQVRGSGPAAIQGAAISLPFTILLMVLVALGTITHSLSYTLIEVSNQAIQQSISINVIDVLLWGLLTGAVFGALGGIYQGSTFKLELSKLTRMLAFPLVRILAPIFILFDRITGQPRGTRASTARQLIYGSVIAAFLLTALAVVVGIEFLVGNRSLTVDIIQHIRDIDAVLLIAIPGLLIIAGFSALLISPPQTVPPAAPTSTTTKQDTTSPTQGGLV